MFIFIVIHIKLFVDTIVIAKFNYLFFFTKKNWIGILNKIYTADNKGRPVQINLF